jgi:CubicO group peptidase (beta-lactamase class C family)
MVRNPQKISRRAVLKKIACGAAVGTVVPELLSCGGRAKNDEPTPAEWDAMGGDGLAFMRKFDVPALSVAIAHHGQFVYENVFGMANRDATENATTKSLFRIASVSKPITSSAIFTLIERGKLGQHDEVFGAGGVLSTKFGTPPYKQWVEQITIDHLLTHSCGGWDNSNDDPMFENPSMNHAELIGWTLDTKPLKNPPGTNYAYSNFGYCVLGRVIEQISGQTYRDFVLQEILAPCGVTDMRIAGDTLPERLPEEVVYYGQGRENPYGMNVARMDSHGGWLASASDLVRFLNHVDGFQSTANILKPETIRLMTAPSSSNPGYARGWAVNNRPNWWHAGSLPGTTTIMVRTASGFCWAALTNTRAVGGEDMGLALDNMVWDMVRKVKAWKA